MKNSRLPWYSTEEVKKYLRDEAIKICRYLYPIAVEVEVIEPLRHIRVFVKCLEEDRETVDDLINSLLGKGLNTEK